MEVRDIVAIVLAIIALLGGMFGQKLLDRWFDREKRRSDHAGNETMRSFADNEQARVWLREQLDESEKDLKVVRENERALLTKVGDLAAQVAGLVERANAQAQQIDELKSAVARWDQDYSEMKAERDAYRAEKHDAMNRLTAEALARQLAEKDLAVAKQEIDRMRGQLSVQYPSQETGR